MRAPWLRGRASEVQPWQRGEIRHMGSRHPANIRCVLCPKHSHDPDSQMTHVLNVARRNGTPHQPRHCACSSCRHGFTHIAQLVVTLPGGSGDVGVTHWVTT